MCGGWSHSNRKQVRVRRVEAEEPAAWVRAVTVGNGVKQRGSHERGREITGWGRDENEVVRTRSRDGSKASWISGPRGGRAEPAGGGGGQLAASWALGELVQLAGPRAVARMRWRLVGGSQEADPGRSPEDQTECLQELVREVGVGGVPKAGEERGLRVG